MTLSNRLIFEMPGTGGVLPAFEMNTMKLIDYADFNDIVILFCQFIFIVFIIYFLIEEIIEIINYGSKYFTRFWNIIDLLVLAVSYWEEWKRVN